MVLVLEMGEFILIGIVLCFIFLQVVVPIVRGTPLYPMFRKERKIKADLQEARQSVIESNLKEEVKKTKQKI